MSAPDLTLCFGVHNHQPVGNFDHVVAEAVARAYHPFLERLRARPEVRATVHFTGALLEWVRDRAPATFDLLGTLVSRGQVELLTGGYFEPILAVIPDHDKIGQVERLTAFIIDHFGVRPRGLWLAERVWEPHLPRALREAGVEYVLVDDRHFALAGVDPDGLDGWYRTEEQGCIVGVVPISQPLRYLIPFADPDETVAYLAARRGRLSVVTVMDDGEKFGVWPGTHRHVYEEGWLDRFFDQLLGLDWLRLATIADVVDGHPPTGAAYLPTASYREMAEWALPLEAGRELRAARRALAALPDGERWQALLRGGFWRAFLLKYPEIGDLYWKMLRLSHAVARETARRPDDPDLAAARVAVWRGQANDAYWHGVFGGCYLPHLRRALKQALLEAEARLAALTGAPAVAWARGDLNGDGREEIVARTPDLALTLQPEAGGTLTEIASLARGLDVADVLTRRPEPYHDEMRAGATAGEAPGPLDYDPFRRASLLDGVFDGDEVLDPVAPWATARRVLGEARYASRVETAGQRLTIVLEPRESGAGLLDKRITVEGQTIEARYRLDPARLGGARWAVQWNLALTAGEGGDRYLDLPGRPALRSHGRMRDLTRLVLVDEWGGLAVELTWSPGAEVAWGPVETVSLSEAGGERLYQGTAFLLVWSLEAVSSDPCRLTTALSLSPR
ncbi:MAG TPA: alpha-amylase/4-alpha-glucanotransferase domain-containing protein [Candidatus Binatia bacterium]|nr:alpha-amylase/4-alpha-glucanotransferase domain-containing protein [Candidatus Binatia bacterium]